MSLNLIAEWVATNSSSISERCRSPIVGIKESRTSRDYYSRCQLNLEDGQKIVVNIPYDAIIDLSNAALDRRTSLILDLNPHRQKEISEAYLAYTRGEQPDQKPFYELVDKMRVKRFSPK